MLSWVANVASELIAEYLGDQVNGGSGLILQGKPGYWEATIATPASAHWLGTVNHEVGGTSVDLGSAQNIVGPVTVIGNGA